MLHWQIRLTVDWVQLEFPPSFSPVRRSIPSFFPLSIVCWLPVCPSARRVFHTACSAAGDGLGGRHRGARGVRDCLYLMEHQRRARRVRELTYNKQIEPSQSRTNTNRPFTDKNPSIYPHWVCIRALTLQHKEALTLACVAGFVAEIFFRFSLQLVYGFTS